LQAGENTIESTPVLGHDVLRWSGSQNALQAGDLGMDVSNGRPQMFRGGTSRDLIHIDESLTQIETIRVVGSPANEIRFIDLDGDGDGAYCLTCMYIGLMDAPTTEYLMYLDINGNGPDPGNNYYVIEETLGAASENIYSGSRTAILHGDNGDFVNPHEGWFQTWIWPGRDNTYIMANTRAGVMHWGDAVTYSSTQHSYMRIAHSAIGANVTSIALVTDITDFFQDGSRATLAWWPMKTL